MIKKNDNKTNSWWLPDSHFQRLTCSIRIIGRWDLRRCKVNKKKASNLTNKLETAEMILRSTSIKRVVHFIVLNIVLSRDLTTHWNNPQMLVYIKGVAYWSKLNKVPFHGQDEPFLDFAHLHSFIAMRSQMAFALCHVD